MAHSTGTTDITTQATKDVETRRPGAEITLSPPVDICETDDGITLLADMPGVSGDRLNVRVEGNALVIEGDAQLDLPEGIQPLYADVRSTRYCRNFGLSTELDTENIDAKLTNGVLTLRIPKRAELRPRKIEVQVH
jgi:HSP20 family protein